MSGLDLDPIKISTHQASTEARLVGLLEQAGSTKTIDDIKNLIFNSTQNQFEAYVEELLAIFDSPESAVGIDAAVPVFPASLSQRTLPC